MNETFDVSLDKYYIYILKSAKDGGWYIGFTTNLKNRLIQHASGKVKTTKFRRPLKLIHYEYFINKNDAIAREKFLKSGFGRSQMKKALQHTITSTTKTSS